MYMVLGGFLVTLLLLLSDPDAAIIQNLPIGASTVATFILLFKTVLYAGILHVTRKGLIDYIDLEEVAKIAMRTPEGAGKVFIGMGMFAIAISLLIFAAVK
jgi:hypothetical protein